MLPPILRRLFSSSPIVAPVLLVLAITMLFLGAHPRTRPQSWVGGAGVGGPVGVGKTYDHGAGAKDSHPIVAPPPSAEDGFEDRLPSAYTSHFPDRVLPAALDSSGNSDLRVRLGAFLRRPILGAADALEKNIAHCPLAVADALANERQLRDQREFWDGVSLEEVAKRRAELVTYLAKKVENGEQVIGKPGTRGIVMTAGNHDTTHRLLTALRVLKKLNVHLPIQVFHYPGELTDEGQRAEIEKLGATVVEVRGVEKGKGEWKSFQIKGFALIQSSFSEILYLDSDNLPLRDPSHLFTAPDYVNRGEAAFWPDLAKDHPSNAVWRLVGEPCSLENWAFESGQMVISKAGNSGLNLAALHLAAGMMEPGPRAFWFRLMEGDKDAFRWAFRILDIPHVAAPRWMSALGFLEADGTFCGHTSLQYDLVTPSGYARPPPLFVHSNLLKHLGAWGRGGEQTGLFSHVKRMAIDAATDSSLNRANLFVRHGGIRNMCLDLAATPVSGEEGTTGGEGENRVLLVPVDEIESKPLAGFEDMFFEAGGRVGGW